jgi:hypothetical protein
MERTTLNFLIAGAPAVLEPAVKRWMRLEPPEHERMERWD